MNVGIRGLRNGTTRAINKVGFQIKKHSPEILVAAGVVGTVTSAVMACKATTKAGDILEEHHEQMKSINEVVAMDRDDYTEEDHKKDTLIVYTQTAVKFVKLYGPSIILGTLSLACIVESHNILRKRNVALAAAYATVDKGFKEYRNRVVERFGAELDRELKYNIKSKEIEETVIDENGKEKTVKKTIEVVDSDQLSKYSPYAKFFDETSLGWERDADYNLMFLRRQQDYANEKLKSRGHLFLNEVYDMLGIARTKAGNVVGWIYDEKNPIGDNYVDFGIYDLYDDKKRRFVNGYERSILLDFNVDGDILDLI